MLCAIAYLQNIRHLEVVVFTCLLFVCLSCFFFFPLLIFLLIFMFSQFRWWPPGDIDAFCCAAGTAAVDMVPVAEAGWPRSSQHPQPGRGNTCELGLRERLSPATPASN